MSKGIPPKAMRLTRTQFTDWNRLPVVIDVDTVSVLLNVHPVTVQKHLKAGTIKGNKLGKAWCIDRDSVRDFVLGARK